jgi:GNAT superfamily N-acetyltransferase
MIRPATPDDVPAIASLIAGLAEYEKLPQEVDEGRLRQHLFGPRPYAEVLLAEEAGLAVGYALFFFNYSTFRAQPGLFLEDLFVLPAHRGKGHGKALLGAVAGAAVARGCARVEWAVLNWNKPAIDFYKALGASPLDDWTGFRLTGEALARASALEEGFHRRQGEVC